jgi:hypothetical protein
MSILRYIGKWRQMTVAARTAWFVLLLVLLAICALAVWKLGFQRGLVPERGSENELKQIQSVDKLQNHYDVIVVGTDPEGVMAAVSAARNGLHTLLVDGRDREILGGLMTNGWLNTIDMNWDYVTLHVPGTRYDYFNKGLFKEFYDKIEGDSFAITTAANEFYRLVANEKNIDLLMKTKAIEPIVREKGDFSLLEGLKITNSDGTVQTVSANTVIDATQDADIAAAAGVPFTQGRQDLGEKETQMAVTLVFRLKNVDDNVWSQIRKKLADDGNPETDANDVSAWGFTEMQNYPAVNKERVKMRGLNIGRQKDNSVLINAMQIFGVDGLDPKSREAGKQIGLQELPHVVDFIKKTYPELSGVELDGTAPELYVRETRHMEGMYRLNIIDILDNRDQWDRIAFGSYRVDLQRTSPTDNGVEVASPLKYAIPFRSIVPLKVDGLLVVGRSASYDSLAHGSARVIPNGMAEGQAAGAAAKLSQEQGVTLRQLAGSKEQVALLQDMLNKQGMELKPYTLPPTDYMKHKAYPGLKAAVYLGIASLGKDRKFDLDVPSNPQRLVDHINTVKKRYVTYFKGDPNASLRGLVDPAQKPLTLTQASFAFANAVGLNVTADKAQTELTDKGLLNAATIQKITDPNNLTNGDVYLLLKDVMERLVGLRF